MTSTNVYFDQPSTVPVIDPERVKAILETVAIGGWPAELGEYYVKVGASERAVLKHLLAVLNQCQ